MRRLLVGLSVLSIFGILASCSSVGEVIGGGGGSLSMEASVSVEYKVDWKEIPVAKMPEKYQVWVNESEEYLKWVVWSIDEINAVRKEIGALFNLKATASASEIASAIRNSVTVKMTLVVVAKASMEAEAGVDANSAHASAKGDAFVSVEWKYEKTVDQAVMAKMDKLKVLIKRMYAIPYVISTMKDKGSKLNSQGLKLKTESVTDLQSDPTLYVHLEKIQGKLQKGSDNCAKGNTKVAEVDNDTRKIINALKDTFPE